MMTAQVWSEALPSSRPFCIQLLISFIQCCGRENVLSEPTSSHISLNASQLAPGTAGKARRHDVPALATTRASLAWCMHTRAVVLQKQNYETT